MKSLRRFAAFVMFAAVFPLFAVEVYRNELEQTPSTEIHFNSYSGPVTVFNTMAQIRGIGTALGQQIAAGATVAGNSSRYQVLHFVEEDSKELDADIFVIGPAAGVDHIRNLRAIVSAYLVAAYNYSVEDADTLATFITVYNAVYRLDMNNISTKYTPAVQNAADSAIVGLSTDYADWPGMTQIIIPLTGRRSGGLSTIDTAAISDSNVVENIREDNNKGVDIRGDMADLKTREAEEAAQNAKDAAKAYADATAEVKEAEKAAEKANADAENAKNLAEANPNDKKLQKKADEAQNAADEANKNLADAKANAADQAAIAKSEQDWADKKLKEAQTDTKYIQKDIETLPPQDELLEAFYGLKIADSSKMLSALVLLDSATGKELKVSPVNVIRGRTVFAAGSNFIAIAGKNGGNAAIRLIIIDGKTLEMIKQSEEPVSEQAVLTEHDNAFYTVINSNGEWKLAKYDSRLRVLAISEISVLEATPIFAYGKTISIVDSKNTVRLLNTENLKVFTAQ